MKVIKLYFIKFILMSVVT